MAPEKEVFGYKVVFHYHDIGYFDTMDGYGERLHTFAGFSLSDALQATEFRVVSYDNQDLSYCCPLKYSLSFTLSIIYVSWK